MRSNRVCSKSDEVRILCRYTFLTPYNPRALSKLAANLKPLRQGSGAAYATYLSVTCSAYGLLIIEAGNSSKALVWVLPGRTGEYRFVNTS
jgi:hypothetical protein